MTQSCACVLSQGTHNAYRLQGTSLLPNTQGSATRNKGDVDCTVGRLPVLRPQLHAAIAQSPRGNRGRVDSRASIQSQHNATECIVLPLHACGRRVSCIACRAVVVRAEAVQSRVPKPASLVLCQKSALLLNSIPPESRLPSTLSPLFLLPCLAPDTASRSAGRNKTGPTAVAAGTWPPRSTRSPRPASTPSPCRPACRARCVSRPRLEPCRHTQPSATHT